MAADILECEEFVQCGNGGSTQAKGRAAATRAAKKGGQGLTPAEQAAWDKMQKKEEAKPAQEAKPAAKGIDTTPLGKEIDDGEVFRKMAADGQTMNIGSTLGKFFYLPPEEIDIGNAKPDPAMVKAFKNGKMNSAIPVIETGLDQYKPVDAVGAKLVASARAAGVDDIAIFGAPQGNTPTPANPTRVQFGGIGRGSAVSSPVRIPREDELQAGKLKPSLTQKQVDSAAKQIRKSKYPQLWQPIPVRQTNRGYDTTYTPVGREGANLMAIAQRAGVKPRVVVVNESWERAS